MWQVLVAAAVAGSGLVARNIFTSSDDGSDQHEQPRPEQLDHELAASSEIKLSSQIEGDELYPRSPDQSYTGNRDDQGEDDIFRFSSFGSKRKKNELKGSNRFGKKKMKKKRIEVLKLERRRLTISLKRMKTGKSGSVDTKACFYNGNTSSLFGWGFGVGIMYMMSTGQSEISKLNATMDQTVKAVGELKNELCKRKASCISKSSCNDDQNTCDGGEYHAVQKMEQLEADLEYELSKLTSCTTEVSFDQGIDSELYQAEILANGGQQMSHSYQFNGVEPSVLDKKLSQLLIQQQESQINELENELQSANSKLHQKEAELKALKDCVRRLSNFSLSNIPENETEITAEAMLAD